MDSPTEGGDPEEHQDKKKRADKRRPKWDPARFEEAQRASLERVDAAQNAAFARPLLPAPLTPSLRASPSPRLTSQPSSPVVITPPFLTGLLDTPRRFFSQHSQQKRTRRALPNSEDEENEWARERDSMKGLLAEKEKMIGEMETDRHLKIQTIQEQEIVLQKMKKDLRDKEEEMDRIRIRLEEEERMRIEGEEEMKNLTTRCLSAEQSLDAEKRDATASAIQSSLEYSHLRSNYERKEEELIEMLAHRNRLQKRVDKMEEDKKKVLRVLDAERKREMRRAKKKKDKPVRTPRGVVARGTMRIRAKPGSYKGARKVTRDARLSHVVTIIKRLLGSHYDTQKALFHCHLGEMMGIPQRLTPEQDSEFCSAFQVCATTRRGMKKKLDQFGFHLFSAERDFVSLRADLSVRRDFIIETQDQLSPFPGVTVAYHSRILPLIIARLRTLLSRRRLDLGSPYHSVIKLVVLADKGDKWTKIVVLILNATGRQMSFRNCSLVAIYDGPDKHSHFTALIQPVFDQLNAANGQIVTLDETNGVCLRARIEIHAGGDMPAQLAMKSMGGVTMEYSCLMCYWRLCPWKDYQSPFVCPEKRTAERERYYLQQSATSGRSLLQCTKGHKFPSLLKTHPDNLAPGILHWKLGAIKDHLMNALLNLIVAYEHEEQAEAVKEQMLKVEEKMEEIRKSENKLTENLREEEILAKKGAILISLREGRAQLRADASEWTCDSRFCLYQDERSKAFPDDYSFLCRTCKKRVHYHCEVGMDREEDEIDVVDDDECITCKWHGDYVGNDVDRLLDMNKGVPKMLVNVLPDKDPSCPAGAQWNVEKRMLLQLFEAAGTFLSLCKKQVWHTESQRNLIFDKIMREYALYVEAMQFFYHEKNVNPKAHMMAHVAHYIKTHGVLPSEEPIEQYHPQWNIKFDRLKNVIDLKHRMALAIDEMAFLCHSHDHQFV